MNRKWYHDSDLSFRQLRASVVIGLGVLGFIIVVLGVVSSVAIINEKSCQTKGEEYRLESDYRFWAGTCFAQLPNGQTVNIDNIQRNSKGYTIYTPDIK